MISQTLIRNLSILQTDFFKIKQKPVICIKFSEFAFQSHVDSIWIPSLWSVSSRLPLTGSLSTSWNQRYFQHPPIYSHVMAKIVCCRCRIRSLTQQENPPFRGLCPSGLTRGCLCHDIVHRSPHFHWRLVALLRSSLPLWCLLDRLARPKHKLISVLLISSSIEPTLGQ